MQERTILATVALSATLAACNTQPQADQATASVQSQPQHARNVILLIGDGMGVSHIAGASQLRHGPAGGLAIESMPHTALMRHASANRVVTDSAASASAMATGKRANHRVISQDANSNPVRTIAQAAADKGLATGLITSTFIFDATPAAFLAHNTTRYDFLDIMTQMIDSNATLLIGGDNAYLLHDAPKTKELEAAEQQQWAELLDRAKANNWTLHLDELPDNISSQDRSLILYSVRGDSPDAFGPPIRESVAIALPRLAADPDGFFLLIESEETDEGAHANHIERTINGVYELDDALADVLEFARDRNDTLVIVTSDHETGGLTFTDEDSDQELEPRWSTQRHSIEWVPVFAEGPGAERFKGVIDNTDIAKSIADLLNLQGVGKAIEY